MARVALQHQGGGRGSLIMVAPKNDICPHGTLRKLLLWLGRELLLSLIMCGRVCMIRGLAM